MSSAGKLTTTLSTKGQVILPKAIRQERQWDVGTRLVIENTSEGVLLKPAPVFPETNPKDVYASLSYGGPPKSIEEMSAGIAAEARRKYARR